MKDENFQKRIGKGMTVLGWILLLLLLTLYFSKFLDKQLNPNQNLQLSETANYKEITLQRNRYGHYVANGQINGNPVVFILDTGATEISVPEHLVHQLNLRAGNPLPVNTANGQIVVYATTLDRVSLGGIIMNDVRANINPYMHSDEILLGMSFLKHLDFSQEGEQLHIRQY